MAEALDADELRIRQAKRILELVCDEYRKSGQKPVKIFVLCKSRHIHVKSEDHLVSFLSGFPSLFEIHATEDRSGLHRAVVPTTNLKLCEEYTDGDCYGHCGNLHICKHFLLGKDGCSFSRPGKTDCHYSHNLYTNHNVKALRSHGLEDISMENLKLLLSLAMISTPTTCKFYNMGNDGCTNPTCPYLHVCRHYIFGQCKFGSRCKRNHNMSEERTRQILRKAGWDPDSLPLNTLLRKLRAVVASDIESASVRRRARSASRPRARSKQDSYLQLISPVFGSRSKITTRVKRSMAHVFGSSPSLNEDSICSFYLTGKCRFGDACFNVHPDGRLPYQWQEKDICLGDWTNMSVGPNVAIEKAYCDPQNGTYELTRFDATLEFDTFMVKQNKYSSGVEIRRLSTKSSRDPVQRGNVLPTEWRWFWLDKWGVWLEYGKTDGNVFWVDSAALERRYIANSNDQFDFTVDQFTYTINFFKMEQINHATKRVRKVRRRPKLVTPSNLYKKPARPCPESDTFKMADLIDTTCATSSETDSDYGAGSFSDAELSDDYDESLCVVEKNTYSGKDLCIQRQQFEHTDESEVEIYELDVEESDTDEGEVDIYATKRRE